MGHHSTRALLRVQHCTKPQHYLQQALTSNKDATQVAGSTPPMHQMYIHVVHAALLEGTRILLVLRRTAAALRQVTRQAASNGRGMGTVRRNKCPTTATHPNPMLTLHMPRPKLKLTPPFSAIFGGVAPAEEGGVNPRGMLGSHTPPPSSSLHDTRPNRDMLRLTSGVGLPVRRHHIPPWGVQGGGTTCGPSPMPFKGAWIHMPLLPGVITIDRLRMGGVAPAGSGGLPWGTC